MKRIGLGSKDIWDFDDSYQAHGSEHKAWIETSAPISFVDETDDDPKWERGVLYLFVQLSLIGQDKLPPLTKGWLPERGPRQSLCAWRLDVPGKSTVVSSLGMTMGRRRRVSFFAARCYFPAAWASCAVWRSVTSGSASRSDTATRPTKIVTHLVAAFCRTSNATLSCGASLL